MPPAPGYFQFADHFIYHMLDDNDQPTPIDPFSIGEFISLKEASEISGLGIRLLQRLASENRLQSKKIGRDWFTTLAAIEEYKKSRHRGKKLPS